MPVRLARRDRGGFSVIPEVVTWDVATFRIVDPDTDRAFVAVLPGGEVGPWLDRLDGGELDLELRRRLERPPRRNARSLRLRHRRTNRARPLRVGVEHEFTIRSGGTVVPFAPVLAAAEDELRLDPIDPNACRRPWGVLTADGPEAEVAIEAAAVGDGFVDEVLARLGDARADLTDRLPLDASVEGYSTHISVSVSARRDDRFARRWAEVFGLGMMLLLDDDRSPGLLVRPRPGRLELGGEFAEGDRLAAALLFAVGSVLALTAGDRALRSLSLCPTLEPARERYGWFLDRRCFGTDLYDGGRAATVTRRSGDVVTASCQLRALLGPVIRALDSVAAPDRHREYLCALLGGDCTLPCEEASS
jgi:hypothetical protein